MMSPTISKEKIIKHIKKALAELLNADGYLFECQTQIQHYYPRKLHEVCINHKLANYFEKHLLPLLSQFSTPLFVDIEFNREGNNQKTFTDRKKETVRPDIIIHNRKSGKDKINFLVVECKKEGASKQARQEDRKTLDRFLNDPKYRYKYALQVIYCNNSINGTFLEKNSEEVTIRYPKDNTSDMPILSNPPPVIQRSEA